MKTTEKQFVIEAEGWRGRDLEMPMASSGSTSLYARKSLHVRVTIGTNAVTYIVRKGQKDDVWFTSSNVEEAVAEFNKIGV